MINTIFNNFGKTKLINVYFDMLLNKKKLSKFKIDNQKSGTVFMRSLDDKPFLKKNNEI